MSLARLGIIFVAMVFVTGVTPGCPSGRPVSVAVYEHSPDAPDPILMSAERGENYQGVAGRTYSFYVTSDETGHPAEWIEYAWWTDTGRASDWQSLPSNGIVMVATELKDASLTFWAAARWSDIEMVKIELISPDSPAP